MTASSAVWSAPGVRWWLVPPPLAVWAPSWWSPTLARHVCRVVVATAGIRTRRPPGQVPGALSGPPGVHTRAVEVPTAPRRERPTVHR